MLQLSTHSALTWQVCIDGSDDEAEAEGELTQVQEWKGQSHVIRGRMNMELDSSPWVENHALSGLDRKRSRCLDLVDVGFWGYLIAHPTVDQRSKYPKWFADCSQSVERRPWGAVLPCINQDSIPYSYELDRVLSLEDRSQRAGVQCKLPLTESVYGLMFQTATPVPPQ